MAVQRNSSQSSVMRKIGIISYVDQRLVKISASESDLADCVVDGDISHINGLDQFLFSYMGISIKVLFKVVSSGLTEHLANYGEASKSHGDITISAVPIGMLQEDKTVSGVFDLPPVGTAVYACDSRLLTKAYCSHDVFPPVELGSLLGYEGVRPGISVDSCLSNHVAILGNTGAGKSTTVRLWLSEISEQFEREYLNPRAKVVVLDVHGDYSETRGSNVTRYSLDEVYLPLGDLSKEDWFSLLSPSEKIQKPLLERGLGFSKLNDNGIKYVYAALSYFAIRDPSQDSAGSRQVQLGKYFLPICPDLETTNKFKRLRDEKRTYKNRVINNPSDLLSEFLLNYGNYPDGLVGDMSEVLIEYIGSKYLDELSRPSIDKIVADQTLQINNQDLSMSRIAQGLELVFAEEQVKGNRQSRAYSEGLISRIHNIKFKYQDNLLNYGSSKRSIFDLLAKETGILIFDLSGKADSDGLRLISSSMARSILENNASKESKDRLPCMLILEEAHRYVCQTGSDEDTIFERIAREGRKFGVFLTIISQIPSELSKVVLSQAGLFIIHRIQNQADIDYLSKNVPSLTINQAQRLPTYPPGCAAVFGNSIAIPFEVKVDGKQFMDVTSTISFQNKSGRDMQSQTI